MHTKEKILDLFESNKGVYFSGEEIATKLSVSRTAVWKAVQSLRSEGYEIDAIQNKGYSLSVNTDIVSPQGIQKYLTHTCDTVKLHILQKVKSTNALLREQADAGSQEGHIIIANAQSDGRGRFGRSFFSPVDTGIYMSLLLRPVELSPEQAVKITAMAAVAVCEAIETVSGKQTWIKWVNDIYCDGRKICGILTEASLSIENGSIDYIIIGIGINVYMPQNGFPEEIEQIAGAVFDKKKDDAKNLLIAEVLNHFMGYYKENANYVQEYRIRSLVIGKQITVLSSSGDKKAFALDVDDTCALIVQYTDGSIEHLSSGEIRINLL